MSSWCPAALLKALHEREEITISKSHAIHVNTLITLISSKCEHNPTYPAVPGSVAGLGLDQMAGIGCKDLPSH